MENCKRTALRFFRVMGSRQAYLNLLYVLAAFPLGVFYFAFLVSGLSAGLALLIVWVGIPILLVVAAGGRMLAGFERLVAVHLLKEDFPAAARPSTKGTDIWTRVREGLADPVTWRSLLYLLLKFPLATASFAVLSVVVSLTVALLTTPATYRFAPEFQLGVFFGSRLPAWRIDSLLDAVIGALLGLMLWPAALHVTNGLAWVHAKLARVMLSLEPLKWPVLLGKV